MAEAPSPLWQYALRVYERPGVPDACLRLQDRHGFDINVVLYLCWCATTAGAVARGTVDAALQATQPWQDEVVQPLRALRRRLRRQVPGADAAGQEAFRGRLKRLELDAERLELDILAAVPRGREAGPAPGRAPAAEAALRLYAGAIGARLEAADEAAVARIAAAAGEG